MEAIEDLGPLTLMVVVGSLVLLTFYYFFGRKKDRRAHVRIIFKSGVELDLKCSEFKSTRSNVTGELTALEWEDVEPGIHSIALKEVAAVVILKLASSE